MNRFAGKKKKVAIVAVIAVAVIAACVAIAVVALPGQGRTSLAATASAAPARLAEGATSDDGGRTVQYKGSTYRLNEDVVAVCVMGYDKGIKDGLHDPREGYNGQADAIMVIAIDTSSGKIQGIAVPRDSMIEAHDEYKAEYGEDEMQLCLAFNFGANDDESSERVCDAVSDILYGIPVKRYFTMGTDGVGVLADKAGGVTLEALDDIRKTSIKKGDVVTLRGFDAMRYVQYRDITRSGTAGERLERQKQFVYTLGRQLVREMKGDPALVVDIFNALKEYSVTNLTMPEFTYLATVAASTDAESVEVESLQGKATRDGTNPWEQFHLDEDSVYQTVLDTFYTKL